jgi:ABC-2 type transport system permease protein
MLKPRVRREGNSLTGLHVVFFREFQEMMGSARMTTLLIIIVLSAAASLLNAARTIQSVVGQDRFLLLSLFSLGSGPFPSFVSFLSFLVPIIGIALGFDAVNSEQQNRTLTRIVSQPIYRDVLLFGKILSTAAVMAIVFLCLWLIIIGFAMLFFGIPPTGEQIARACMFYLLTVMHGILWYVIALFFSIVFRQPATSALVSLAVWLLFTVFWSMIISGLAQAVVADEIARMNLQQGLSKISPVTLYNESALAMLHPSTRTLGTVVFSQLQGALLGSPLPFSQSLLLIWPHVSGFTAGTILILTLSYMIFQRREIRD